jgi:hypothetical protein
MTACRSPAHFVVATGPRVQRLVRSIVFNALFYLNCWCTSGGDPDAGAAARGIVAVTKPWARSSL